MKKNIVQGSVEELMGLIATGDCKGDVSELCDAFVDKIYCHQRKYALPLVMAPVLTPFHTEHMDFNGHSICEVHCGRACQYVDFMPKIAYDSVPVSGDLQV